MLTFNLCINDLRYTYIGGVYKSAIMGALELYLDFLNLFLFLLRLFGASKD